MKFDSVYKVQKEFSTDAFLRQTLIALGVNKDTPIDVVDVCFGEVREGTKEVMLCTANVEGECVASVGYDRKEPYIDYETYQEKVGGTYVTRKRQVTKYKTVTDWHPYSSRYSGKSMCAAYNTEEDNSDDGRIVKALTSLKEESISAGEETAVIGAAFNAVVKSCEKQVERKETNFPGSHVKDKKYHSKATVESLICFKLPYYEVTYTYKGEEYTVEGFACGIITPACEHPSIDIDVTKIVQEQTKDLAAKEKLLWYSFTGSVLLSVVMLIVAKFGWVWPVSVVCLILAMMVSKRYRKEYEACSDKISGDVMRTKVEALQNALRRHGFDALHEVQIKALDSFSVDGADKLKDLTNRIQGCWILVAILAIGSFMF